MKKKFFNFDTFSAPSTAVSMNEVSSAKKITRCQFRQIATTFAYCKSCKINVIQLSCIFIQKMTGFVVQQTSVVFYGASVLPENTLKY